jgi:hypothetical protein
MRGQGGATVAGNEATPGGGSVENTRWPRGVKLVRRGVACRLIPGVSARFGDIDDKERAANIASFEKKRAPGDQQS